MEVNLQVELNQKDCLEIAQSELYATQSRMRDLEGKHNMLLVFLSALIVCLGTVTSMQYAYLSRTVLAFVIISMILMVGAVVSILIGILPREYYAIDTTTLVDGDKHSQHRHDFLMFYLNAYKACIDKLNSVCKKKRITIIISICLLAAAFVLLIISILILL